MKAFIKKIGIILFIALGLIILISSASLWVLQHASFYKPSFLTNTVKEKEFDYVILGASTGLTTLNTKVIDSALHIKGINLSMDDTALSSQYLMLQHFLAEGKSTKFCVLAPSASSFDANITRVSDNDYRFLMFVNNPYVSDYYKEMNGKEAYLLYNSKWISAIGVSYYNAEIFYPSMLCLFKPNKRNRFDDKGNYTYPVVVKKNKEITNFKEFQVGFTNTYLKKIKTLCALHNIKLICYLSPMQGKKAVSNSLRYSIINHSDLLKNTKYFYDVIHVNSIGRQVTSISFANEFIDFILPSNIE